MSMGASAPNARLSASAAILRNASLSAFCSALLSGIVVCFLSSGLVDQGTPPPERIPGLVFQRSVGSLMSESEVSISRSARVPM